MLRPAILLVVAAVNAPAQTLAAPPEPPKYSAVVRAVVAAPLDSVKRRVIRVFAARTPDMDTVTVDNVHRVQTERFYVRGAGLLQIAASVRADSAGAIVELRGTRRFMRRFFVALSGMGDEVPIFSGDENAQVQRAWDELMAIATDLRPVRMSYARGP